MKRTRTLILAAVVLPLVSLMGTASLAALDPKLDSFGVYFDTAATVNYQCAPIGTMPVRAYIMLVNPTTPIKGFELAYRIDGWMEGIVVDPDTGAQIPQGFVRTLQTKAGGSLIDVGDSRNGGAGSFAVGYATLRPATPVMRMVTWVFVNWGDMGPDPGLQFFLTGLSTHPSPSWPMINSGAAVNALRRATVFSGSLTLPVARTSLNGTPPCPPAVGEETSNFGSVKSLFR